MWGGSDSSIEKGNLSSFFFSILPQITLTQLTNFNFERDRQDKKILLESAAKVFAPAPLAGGLVFFSFWVLLGSSSVPSGVLLLSSGVLLAFFWRSITQKNTRRTQKNPEEHQKNTRRNARRTQKNPEGEEHQPPLYYHHHHSTKAALPKSAASYRYHKKNDSNDNPKAQGLLLIHGSNKSENQKEKTNSTLNSQPHPRHSIPKGKQHASHPTPSLQSPPATRGGMAHEEQNDPFLELIKYLEKIFTRKTIGN